VGHDVTLPKTEKLGVLGLSERPVCSPTGATQIQSRPKAVGEGCKLIAQVVTRGSAMMP
jgi:hypothetical protein